MDEDPKSSWAWTWMLLIPPLPPEVWLLGCGAFLTWLATRFFGQTARSIAIFGAMLLILGAIVFLGRLISLGRK